MKARIYNRPNGDGTFENEILIAGHDPFWSTLRPDKRETLGYLRRDFVALERFLEQLSEAHVKIHEGDSTGMGMFLVFKISLLSGMEPKLILRDPWMAHEEYGRVKRIPKQLIQLPLCLRLRWKGGDAR